MKYFEVSIMGNEGRNREIKNKLQKTRKAYYNNRKVLKSKVVSIKAKLKIY